MCIDFWYKSCASREYQKILSQNFDTKDLGEAYVFLGIKIIQVAKGLTLSQSHYIEKVLKRFNNFDCKPIPMPFDVRLNLSKEYWRTSILT